MSKIERQQIRQTIRAKRQALSKVQQSAAQIAVKQQVAQLELIKPDSKVAVYLTNDGELNPASIIEFVWQQNAKVYLPVLHPFAKNYLAFFEYNQTTALTHNKFGIAEPKLNAQTICPVNNLDIIFLPLVAFDAQGNRMGMGGGFYDRTFANAHPQQKRIGLAHDCQQLDALPTETWDVPLDMLITPTQIIFPRRDLS
ncbi:5-formyltetrahydrofolate cyclo-ligase [Catenovulum sp. 2E275]|uniref:5-formyltetrahydrofolate cyclo-ligase n=1 Tax=Catenovulum sp. 2E275 TaxID=2980497 RepID=UPI0021D17B46|nr:5-formyltetrahydrofolate cyclo-ligase [Catenovulum sp. 2E275]MCU4676377.1 5-formyltetrahydrofolate cyclo-ligase [Catenovulum sp. 2E275]